MALEIRPPDCEDPFGDLSRLSLFPQTLAASTGSNTGSETQRPDSVEKIFKSMVLKGSEKLLEQALVISKSSSNTENLFLEAEDKAVVANGRDKMDRPLGRRPALGRRRAQFNLKTVQSDSKADSGIYDIVEPHEYFSAVDQMQKAEEELKKCRDGAATDLAQIQQYATVRSRRMGLLGRTATYKHHLSANADTTETFVASQEATPGRRITSPAKIPTDGESSSLLHLEPTEKGSPLATRVNNELPNDTKEEGSIAQEKSVEDLLDKLFSTFKDLNGGNGIALLQERLQIKSTDVSKMILPELDSTQRDNLRVPKNTLTRKRLDGSQLPPTMSPNTTKNPLAVIANLQRRISLRDHLPDPYSMPTTDDAPLSPADIDCGVTNSRTSVGISTPVIVSGKRSNSVEKMHLPVHEPVETLGSKKTSEDVINHVPSLEKEGDDMQLNPSVCAQPDPVVKDLTSSFVNQNDMDVFASQSKRNMDGNSSSRINVSSGSFGSDISLQGEVSVVLDGEPVPYSEVSKESTGGPSTRRIGMKTTSSGIDVAGSLGQDAILQDKVNVVVQGEPPSYAEASRDNRSIPGVLLEEDGTLENLHNLAEENNEILRFQEASEVSPKMGRKRKLPPNGQSKEKPTSRKQPISKRQSLADAGMMWKSGVRRSTRIKSRPLQYWCGERFLLGRIHDSLATVIGVKYACPGDDGKSPVLKVKSFVSEEYADLVSQVAV